MTDIREFADPRKEHGSSEGTEAAGVIQSPRPKASDRAVRLALASGIELWHDPDLIGYVSLAKAGHRENHPIKSKAARLWLGALFYETERRGLGHQDCADALGLLEAKAIHEGPEHPIAVRVAHLGGCVLLDLGRPEWEAVEVTPNGWTVRPASELPVRFKRPAGLLALPLPKPGGDLLKLVEVLNTDEEGIRLALAWLLFAMGGPGPYPILALAGEQGTGKSTAARVLREIVDPNSVGLRTTPKEERDLAIAAQNAHILGFDNFSSIPDWLSDALCRLATGAGFATRALYTDSEETLFSAKRPIVLNGIPDLMTRGDLADRALAVTLERIREEDRKPESEVWALVESVKPDILGGLLDAVVVALRNLPGLRLPTLPRMADFARFIVAAEPALPWKPGEFLSTYQAAREDGARILLEGDAIAALVVDITKRGQERTNTWTGTASDLMKSLEEVRGDGMRSSGWPKSARGLSSHLRRIAPALRQTGLEVEHGKGGGKLNARTITLRLTHPKDGNRPSEPSEGSKSLTAQADFVRTQNSTDRPNDKSNRPIRTQSEPFGRNPDPTVRQQIPCAISHPGNSDATDANFPSLGGVSGDAFEVDL